MRVAHESRGMEPAGVRRLVEAHYSDVYAYCRRRTESVDEAEDAVQEVFLRFVGASGRYRDDGRPLAYLLTIARVTGLSRFAVARRIGSALSDIREALASEEGDA